MLKIYNIKPYNNPNELILRDYDDFLKWDFKIDTTDNEGGIVMWKCTYSGLDIKKGVASHIIQPSEYEIWKGYIVDWINSNNIKVLDENIDDYELVYKMVDVDEDFCYTYEKYINGTLTKTGKGWLKDLKYNYEKKAWRKAIKEYQKANNIETESKKRKNKREKSKKKIKDLDQNLPEKTENTPPILPTAISKLDDSPCEFISEIMQKGTQCVTGLSIKELINYYTKQIKENMVIEINNQINSQTSMVESVFSPVDETLDSFEDYFEQLDTDRDEWLKTHSEDICLFKMVEMDVQFPSTHQSSETSTTSVNTTFNISTNSQKTNTSNTSSSTISKNGTFEWNHKRANEDVITEKGKLWKIISEDLGTSPTAAQANASMTTIEVKTRDENGVLKMRKINVHKATAGTVKRIFDEIYNNTNFKIISKTSFQLGGFNHRYVRGSTTALSQHSFGSAIDINPVKNPMMGSKSKDVDNRTESDNNDFEMRTINHKVVKIMAKYGYGWGGCYSDYMHFSCKTKINNKGWLSGC